MLRPEFPDLRFSRTDQCPRFIRRLIPQFLLVQDFVTHDLKIPRVAGSTVRMKLHLKEITLTHEDTGSLIGFAKSDLGGLSPFSKKLEQEKRAK
jgi:hypothetical protein